MAMNRLDTWSDTRLKQTRAYLTNCIQEGMRTLYDPEEHRLQLDDVNQELSQRSIRNINDSEGNAQT